MCLRRLTYISFGVDREYVHQISRIRPRAELEFTDLCVEGEIPDVHRAFPVQNTQTVPSDVSLVVHHDSALQKV